MTSKKQITQVLYSGLGGHGTVAFNLLEGFNKSYTNSFVFYGIEDINNEYKTKLELNKIKYFGIKKNKIDIKGWIKYYSYLKTLKPDVILLHSNQLILISFLYRLFNKTKIITVEHDAISVRTKFKWVISNLNAIFASKIVVLSNNYKKHIKKHLWFKNLLKKYIIIPNGIDVDKFNQKDFFSDKETITLFMASRMNKLRDHTTLIDAVKLVHKKYNQLELRIAGDGNTLLELKEKYNKLPFITFLGNINQKEIIKELQKTDIYIHTTFAETFSTAILQAMSCGLPIICSDIEGTRHMIKNNRNGLLYNNKDIEDLANKITLLLNNKQLAIRLGNNARKDVEIKYSNSIIIKKYLAIFNSI